MTTDTDDYAADVELDQPTDRLEAIVALARQQIELEDAIVENARLGEELVRQLRAIREGSLPEALEEVGLASLPLLTGETVTIQKDVIAGITEANAAAAHAWLRENEHGDLIKQTISVAFGKGQEDLAANFMKMVRELPFFKKVRASNKEGVHYQTLRAFVREQLALGVELPDSITAIPVKRTVVERPKLLNPDDTI